LPEAAVEPSVQAFKLPKKGNSEEEYEDACDFSPEARRFAISDGATESCFADRWAKSLVKQYIVDPPFGVPPTEDALQLWLLPQQEEWRLGVNWSALPWYLEEKARNGAYAAFLGVEFGSGGTIWQKFLTRAMPGEELAYNAFAIGDSCLFQVRNGQLLKSFPMEKAEQFNSRPVLLASNPMNNDAALKQINSTDGTCRPKDLFLLATDALSKWFLSEVEASRQPWEILYQLKTNDDFAVLVDQLRASGALKNDDTTLILLEWAGSGHSSWIGKPR
jgi:hypothetical protein